MTTALHKLKTLVKSRKRVGRGGSRGGTSGKGTKGQNARSGGYKGPRFEGGQMPLYRRLPKRGFTNARFSCEIDIISTEVLEKYFDKGDKVTRDVLVEKGLVKGRKSQSNHLFKLKILGGFALSKPLIVYADAFSKSAIEAIQGVGGEAHLYKGAE